MAGAVGLGRAVAVMQDTLPTRTAGRLLGAILTVFPAVKIRVLEQMESSQELCFLTFFLELLGHIQIPLLLMRIFPLTLLSFK